MIVFHPHLGKVVVEASDLQFCKAGNTVCCQPARVTVCKESESAHTKSCFLQLMDLVLVAGYYVRQVSKSTCLLQFTTLRIYWMAS